MKRRLWSIVSLVFVFLTLVIVLDMSFFHSWTRWQWSKLIHQIEGDIDLADSNDSWEISDLLPPQFKGGYSFKVFYSRPSWDWDCYSFYEVQRNQVINKSFMLHSGPMFQYKKYFHLPDKINENKKNILFRHLKGAKEDTLEITLIRPLTRVKKIPLKSMPNHSELPPH